MSATSLFAVYVYKNNLDKRRARCKGYKKEDGEKKNLLSEANVTSS